MRFIRRCPKREERDRLRSVARAPRDRRDEATAHKKNNPHPSPTCQSTVGLGLAFAPTSFAVDGAAALVAAGGQHGQLDVRRLGCSEPLLRSAGGGAVINGVALAPRAGAGAAGSHRVFVAANDCVVRAYDVPVAESADADDAENVAPVVAQVAAPDTDDDEDAPAAASDSDAHADDAPPPPILSPRRRDGHGRPAAPSDAATRAARARAAAPVATVRALDPVNYCALAPAAGSSGPAGRALASVGDCAALTLHAPAADGSYTRVASWDAFRDAGMAAAWSPGGSWLAAAGQCGTVVAVDPRAAPASGPVAALRVRGAARALKVCPGPADLVLVTEHDTRAHVFDARTWTAVHSVRVGGAAGGDRGPALSGAAFSPDGSRAFVGVENGGVAVFGVRSADRCCVAEWEAR